MSLYRIRFAFEAGAWRVVSCKRSNEWALVPVQNVERKGKCGRYLYLPVLAVRQPAAAGTRLHTPYAVVMDYLAQLPVPEKDRRQAEAMGLRRQDEPLPELDFA